MANRSERTFRTLGELLAGLLLVLGVCNCRSTKQAPAPAAGQAGNSGDAEQVADGGLAGQAADLGLPAATWASWPMPNTTAGLPNQQSLDTNTVGVVLDRVTGLVWQRELDTVLRTYAEAKQHCDTLTLGGYDDWRLPSRIELVSILDSRRTQPAIDVSAFPGTPNDWFWTSSLSPGDAASAWYVYFYFGYPKTDLVSNQFSVRCVRTPNHAALATHYDVLPDTVRDLGTGLTWQRAVPDQMFDFDAAHTYCAGLSLAGKTAWRVPSLTELLTLIDERASAPPMIDGSAFPNTPSEAFWSSSYFGGAPGMSWQVYFDHGNGLYGLPDAAFRVRCVL
jgi:hypothetical protein